MYNDHNIMSDSYFWTIFNMIQLPLPVKYVKIQSTPHFLNMVTPPHSLWLGTPWFLEIYIFLNLYTKFQPLRNFFVYFGQFACTIVLPVALLENVFIASQDADL